MNSPATIAFQHRHAAHCESGTAASLLTHAGISISEPMAFGLGRGLGFAYLPFVRIQEMPLIAYRTLPRGIIKGVSNALGIDFQIERFRSPEAGTARLDALLREGRAVGLQSSVFWLPYFPHDMRFHFNAHNLVAYGLEGENYLISDPVLEHVVQCPRIDLERARFTEGALAPKGLLYFVKQAPRRGPTPAVTPAAISKAIKGVARTMLAPIPFVGTRGIQYLANTIQKLDPAAPGTSRYLGHVVRMQEEIGTGGGGFRFLYAAFLQEASEHSGMQTLAQFSDRLLEIGDGWRAFALAAARMVKGREPIEPRAIAQLLSAQSRAESLFFRELRSALRSAA
jgi:hypothetical protein